MSRLETPGSGYLRSIGVEYPREHDVSRALEMTKDKFPDWFVAKIPENR